MSPLIWQCYRSHLRLAVCAALGAIGLLSASAAFAHPSGLPALKERADFVVDNAADWIAFDLHPSILIGILTLTLLYNLAVTVWRVRFGWSKTPVEPKQRGLFHATMILLFFTLDGPLHHLADNLLFSAHMLQHMILQLLWAPLLIISVPDWLWRVILLKNPTVAVMARWLTRPMVAFVLYNGVIFGWHFPDFYNAALSYHPLHIFQHLVFMSTAIVMWWVMISPLPELRASYGKRMVFILINMLMMKALGLMLSMSDHVLYTFYLTQPRAWGMDALSDQQLGGMLMWLPGGALLWAGLGRVWWQWVRTGTPARGLTGIAEIDNARKSLIAQQKAAAL